ncbi:MAG: hypothetical protein VX715_06145 [Planctomycetota bacterium]|nr:hypothetical protein [Planctomycetota bacterium]
MLSRRRWMVGLGILIAGCCAAIPFQRQASMDHGPSERLTRSSPQLWLAATESDPTSPPSQGIEDHHRIESLRLRIPSPVTAPRRPVQQVPSIDDRYPIVTGEPDQETRQVSSSQSQQHETASDRYHHHRIQDGDTLRNLAEQYLGNADLAASIYDANRSILASPDLLPLGRQLRIPVPR